MHSEETTPYKDIDYDSINNGKNFLKYVILPCLKNFAWPCLYYDIATGQLEAKLGSQANLNFLHKVV